MGSLDFNQEQRRYVPVVRFHAFHFYNTACFSWGTCLDQKEERLVLLPGDRPEKIDMLARVAADPGRQRPGDAICIIWRSLPSSAYNQGLRSPRIFIAYAGASPPGCF